MKRNHLFFALLAAGAATPALAQQYNFFTISSFQWDPYFGYNPTKPNGYPPCWKNGPDSPMAPPIVLGEFDFLYGTTTSGGTCGYDTYGTVYSMNFGGGSGNVIGSFVGTNGQYPQSDLVASGSTLYGTTAGGGANGCGVVFSVPISGNPGTLATALASFDGDNGAGAVAGLVVSGGNLYGVAAAGGAYGNGTVFSVPLSGGTITALASFNGANGGNCTSDLVVSGSTLYGVAEAGGAYGDGTIFSVPITGGNITTLASFNGTNGANPESNLVVSGGSLYGTARNGGAYGNGAVFAVPVTGGNITAVASFNGTDGANPLGDMIVDSAGYMVGTTSAGGPNYGGTVFSVPISGGTPTVVEGFTMSINAAGGFGPNGLCADTSADGALVGTTAYGGPYDGGTVFDLIDPAEVPEPASLSLLAVGGIGLLTRRRRR